jgi:hypothetical protein
MNQQAPTLTDLFGLDSWRVGTGPLIAGQIQSIDLYQKGTAEPMRYVQGEALFALLTDLASASEEAKAKKEATQPPEGYVHVLVPTGSPGCEPDWDDVRHQAETATGLQANSAVMNILIREVRRWIIHRDEVAKAAPTAELADALARMLERFTRTPSTLLDSEARVAGHKALETYRAYTLGSTHVLLPNHPTTEMAKASHFRYCPEFIKDYKAMLASIPQPEGAAAPDGFVWAPKDPTPEMARAGCYRYCPEFVKDYKAMWAAAPSPIPAPEATSTTNGHDQEHPSHTHTATRNWLPRP